MLRLQGRPEMSNLVLKRSCLVSGWTHIYLHGGRRQYHHRISHDWRRSTRNWAIWHLDRIGIGACRWAAVSQSRLINCGRSSSIFHVMPTKKEAATTDFSVLITLAGIWTLEKSSNKLTRLEKKCETILSFQVPTQHIYGMQCGRQKFPFDNRFFFC